jgi:RNA polymerase sigma-70 factor (ECF subfamily)
MVGVAMRLVRRRAVAEDVVHDTFVLIWRHAARYDPARGAPRAWIYTILRNRALSLLRDERRTELTDDPHDLEEASADESPEETVLRLSEGDALRHCLQRLEPRRRALVVLSYMHGLSHGELAARLGVPLGTVKSWLRRSLGALRECLA